MSGTLYIVATPIGNLDDLSPRARQTLAAVDVIAAEDTRHTGRLLSHIGVKTPLTALHEHNETREAERLVETLQDGRNVALVSDAGTPLLSDPGYRLVAAARAAGVPGRGLYLNENAAMWSAASRIASVSAKSASLSPGKPTM